MNISKINRFTYIFSIIHLNNILTVIIKRCQAATLYVHYVTAISYHIKKKILLILSKTFPFFISLSVTIQYLHSYVQKSILNLLRKWDFCLYILHFSHGIRSKCVFLLNSYPYQYFFSFKRETILINLLFQKPLRQKTRFILLFLYLLQCCIYCIP